MNIPTIVPVLVYHHCPDDFGAHLAYFKRRDLAPVHLTDIADYFESQSPSKFPQRTIVITFDDGYRDFKESALPMLESATAASFQCKVTVCIPTGCISGGDSECLDIESSDLMTWAELQELARHPLIQFIPHSVSHSRFDQFDRQVDKEALLEYEIGNSKQVLVERLKLLQDPFFFCLPGGAGWKTGKEADPGDRLIVSVLKGLGYKGALRAEYRSGEEWNQYCIPRCAPDSFERLRELLEHEFSCK